MALTPATPTSKPAQNLVPASTLWNDLINCFKSIQLAIVLLSLLAIGTIIGVVMPQEGMASVSDIQHQFGLNYKFLNTLGFFNVYSSFWFITLQILFFFNLLIGSFKWLKPATLAAIQKYTLSPELILHKPDVFSLPRPLDGSQSQVSTQLSKLLKTFHYQTVQDESGNLYASKGNLTRLGPCMAHLGILLCLIAGLYSCFTGFKAVKMAIPGQSFSMSETDTFKTNVPMNIWMGKVPNWKIRVNDFRMEFYKDHPETVKQYYSDLQVVDRSGKVLKTQTISVNHPMVVDDVTVYQASFAPTGKFLLKVNGRPMTVAVNNQFNQRPISLTPLSDGTTLIMFPFFAQQDPGVTKNYAVFFQRKPGEAFGGNGQMPENIKIPQGQTGHLKDLTITYEKPVMSTGLQIKRAPEVPLMYLSYLIICIGAVMCYFSQRQIWIALREVEPGKTEVIFHPKTNKARLSFQKELSKILENLNQTFKSPKPIEDLQQ